MAKLKFELETPPPQPPPRPSTPPHTHKTHTLDLQSDTLATAITKTRLFKYIENFTTKNENFQIKTSDVFHISAQNIDCGCSLEPPRRGGSNGYPQSMFLSRNKENNVYPCKPQFYYIKVGFKGINIIKACFRDGYGDRRPADKKKRQTKIESK